jgi:3-oxoacyl-[acyl-carrier protein] reductase
MGIEGKVALVTGASRGIGQAIALQLGAQGAVMIGTATSQMGADSITTNLAGAGIRGTGMLLDVTDADSINITVQKIQDAYGVPAILVNNAGITRDNLLMRMKDDDWHHVIDTNLNSIYRLCKACIRGMTKARWGRIINISSVVGSMGNMGQTNYAATKAGIEGFSRAMAREVASRNITVNSIAPGFINTDMTDTLLPEQKSALKANIPMNRLGSPDDIAAVAVFLAGEGSKYITGETIHVNGGMYMG